MTQRNGCGLEERVESLKEGGKPSPYNGLSESLGNGSRVTGKGSTAGCYRARGETGEDGIKNREEREDCSPESKTSVSSGGLRRRVFLCVTLQFTQRNGNGG